jgi:hypothetical protein
MASEARISSQSGTAYNGYGDSKYDLKSYTYPENLFSNKNEFANTWVMININVLEQSSAYKQDQTVELSPEEQGKRWTQADARDQTKFESTAAATASTAAVGGLAALLAGKTVVESSVAAVRSGTVGALAVGAPLLVAGTGKRQTKRLSAAIQLPMPNNLMTPYSVDWGTDDTKMFDLALRIPGMAARAGGKLLTGDFEGLAKEGSGAADLAASAALSVNSALGSGGVSAASGLASNPKKEMIFSGVDFRNFTMDYLFYPKSMAETLYVKNIIDMLKFHMYPEYKSKERFTFIYPSEFDITFFVGTEGKENPWVNRVATSVLTNMAVNYTPQGVWAVHADGSPVMIQLSLTFKELSIITKDNLNNPAMNTQSEVKASF